ncbi:MAG: ABC transporter ATP-binding protein [Selenomonadaceae bacterium]|nr:ABC transporter ATP-binding protein [Selenomonadaceae bacterium]
MILSVKNLSVAYERISVVNNISFDLPRGEILAIVGKSGCGKSTVLKAINGLLGRNARITNGSITFDGRDITRLDQHQRRKLAGRSMSMIFQNAASSFCPIRTVGDQIYESVRAHTDWSRQMFHARAFEIMDKLNLNPNALDEYPFRLSGGMAQRVGILAAMILKPKLLLADEPTSALDTVTQADVVNELLKLRKRDGVSIVIVTHHLGVANFIADRIIKL